MSASVFKCNHPETAVNVAPAFYEQEKVTVLTIRMSCNTCGARFAFRGLSNYPSPAEPWVTEDGFTAALPMDEVSRPKFVS
jgi:hypothetical protein